MSTGKWIAAILGVGAAAGVAYLVWWRKDEKGSTYADDRRSVDEGVAEMQGLQDCMRAATDPATGKYDSAKVAACMKAKGLR